MKTGLNNVLMNKPATKGIPGNKEDGEQNIIQPDLGPENNFVLREYSFQRLQKPQWKDAPDRQGDDDAWFYVKGLHTTLQMYFFVHPYDSMRDKADKMKDERDKT